MRIAWACEAWWPLAIRFIPEEAWRTRTAHLKDLRTPCLIVQGTRDALGSRDEVPATSSRGIECTWLDDGDHSFEPRKSSGRTFEENLALAVSATLAFAARLAP